MITECVMGCPEKNYKLTKKDLKRTGISYKLGKSIIGEEIYLIAGRTKIKMSRLVSAPDIGRM